MNGGMEIQQGVLLRYTLREAEAIVPDGVRSVGPGAFKGCVSLERIVLPDSVREIGPEAFKGCRRLQRVRIPQKLERLGAYAFYRCHALEAVSLPAGVEELGDCTFLYCDSLVRADIPGVVRLGRQVFLNDLALEEVTLSPALPVDQVLDVFTGCGRLSRFCFPNGLPCRLDSPIQALSAGFDGPELVRVIAADVYRSMALQDGVMKQFRTNLPQADVPEGVTAIDKSCFFDKRGISCVKLPQSLRTIGSRAFANCINLERLELGSLEVDVAPDAFQNCSALRQVLLPDGRVCILEGLSCTGADLPPLVAEIHAQLLQDFVLSGDVLLQYLGREVRPVVPRGVRVIGPRAFADNDSIDRVILPDTVEEIQAEAFAGCPTLQAVSLPGGLRRLGQGAFAGCRKLIRTALPAGVTAVPASAFRRCDTLREAVLPETIREIGPLAFDGCLSLKKIDLPPALNSIGDMAFYKCGLGRVSIPAGVDYSGNNAFAKSALTAAVLARSPARWGENCFAWCPRLKRLALGWEVRTLGTRAAFQCPRLERVDWPDSLDRVGTSAFSGTPFLATLADGIAPGGVLLDGKAFSGSVTLPEGITAIGGGAFASNTALTALRLPESVGYIGPQAFLGCSNLTDVTLPSALTVLEAETFALCPTLRAVRSGGELTSIGPRAFAGCRALEELPVLAHDLHLGAYALEDTALLARLRQEGPLVVLGCTAVDGRGCAGTATLPQGVRRVADFAFCGNENLKQVHFPASLEEVGAGAFQRTGLTALNCPAEVIGPAAFAWCAGLKEVDLPRARVVHARTFQGCRRLRRCAVPLTERVEEEAFQNCPRLEEFPAFGAAFIGARAFAHCLALRRAALAEGVRLGSLAFEDCARLEELSLSAPPELEGDSLRGCTGLASVRLDGQSWPLERLEALFDPALPQPVRTIWASALSCFTFRFSTKTLTGYQGDSPAVRIPAGVREIGPEVFRDRLMLEELEIPASVTAIGPRAFQSTPWLERQKEAAPLPLLHGILPEAAPCRGVVTLPREIRRVAGWAFTNQYGLEGLRLENNCTFLEEFAFRNCINLRFVALADGRTFRLDRLEDRDRPDLPPFVRRIFQDCMNCFKVDGQGVLVECTGNIPRLNLPLGITAIGDGVFADSNLLERIRLTPEVREIGVEAFARCRWLEELEGGGSVERIGDRAFFGCTGLRRAELGPGLQEIGKRAFEGCVSLKAAVLPEGLTAIPQRAFFRCRALTRVVLPASLRRVEGGAFAGCANLRQVILPPGAEVAPDAFAGCPAPEVDR